MRGLLVLVLSLAAATVFAQEKTDKAARLLPIPVVQIQRTEPVSYEQDVEPILVNKCQFCHSGAVQEGKLDMSTYELLRKGGKKGPPVVPGKASESLLVQLAGKTQKPLMPPKSEEPLTPEELALIKLWIDQGAKAPAAPRVRPRVALAALPAAVHPVRALAISPDKGAVAAGRGNAIHIYDAGSGRFIR